MQPTLRNSLYKLFWTTISVGTAGIAGPAIFDFEVWKGAATAALGVVINGVSLIARAQADKYQ